MDDYIEDVLPTMAQTRHRYFPVVDSAGRYKGMVSRRNFLGASKKKVILVDHNEKSQAVNGVDTADLLEIIDHHRLGTITTSRPVYFRNQPVGCTCTIIYQMFMDEGIEIPKDIAGLMLSAIISDTLLYRSPTCTQADRIAGEGLAKIAEVDPEELATAMFTAGSDMGDKTPDEILHQDFKRFTVGDHTIAVGQISTMDSNEVELIKDRLAPDMERLRDRDNVDMLFFMITNILQESSDVLFSGSSAEVILETGFNVTSKDHKSVHLPGVVSRKKQMLPTITGSLQGIG
jgi:manganese-dependent inorganic pyrophosphatase